MIILINNEKAVLKNGLSFDFITENSYFTGADSYTLSINFPLAGCPTNIAIFGYLNRKDYDLDTLLLECEIHDKDFHAYGSVSIVDINETEVKTQFLEGRSANNYYSSFDDVYINEVQMSSLYEWAHWNTDFYFRSYTDQRREKDSQSGRQYLGYVVFPWVNNTTGNIQNPMNRNASTGKYTFAGGEDPEIVGQPFLMEVLNQLFDELGYAFDASQLEDTYWENIVVCNTLPLTWNHYAMNDILPHWTVTEFIEQLELFMGVEFVIDHRALTVKIESSAYNLQHLPVCELKKIVDEYKVEIEDDDSTSSNVYMEERNLAYADCDHQMWKFYSCPWLKKKTNTFVWSNIATMQSALSSYLTCDGALSHSYYKRVHYCKTEDTYFVLRCYSVSGTVHYLRLTPVDVFGPHIVDESEDADSTELNIVPACIDYAGSNGDMLYIECGTYDNDVEGEDNADQTVPVNLLTAGESEQKEAFFDKLYVGWWNCPHTQQDPYMPHPLIDKYEVLPNGTVRTVNFSMRLRGSKAPVIRNTIYDVEQKQKYTFSFLADSIPNVKSIFLIHGKRYLAEKITTTFTEDGMSQLMKMVCYRVKEADE